MVKHSENLSSIFAALANPTRRGILEQLARGQTRVTDLARPYQISLPAVSKHLRVLEKAELISRSRVGREHRIRIDPRNFRHIHEWLSLYAEVWQEQFNALDDLLKRTTASAENQPITKRKKKK